jgi:hypothetical protein
MPRYTVFFSGLAQRQRDGLPPAGQRGLEKALERLAADPRGRGTWDGEADVWTADFGARGLLLYSVDDSWITMTVLRVTWVG